MRNLMNLMLGIAITGATARSDTRIEVEWSRGTELPVSVAGHSAAFVEGQIISAGGSRWRGAEKELLTSVIAWKPGEDQWRTLGRLPSPVAYSASAAHGRELLILGGSSGDRAITDVVAVDMQGAIRRLPSLPLALDSACAAVLGDRAFVVGGTTDSSDYSKVSDTILWLDLAKSGSAWTVAARDPLCGRAIAAAVPCAGKLYVFGGYTGVDLASAFCFSPEDGRITKLSDLPSPRRGCAAAVFGDRYILLAGGCGPGKGSGMLDELLVFDTVENRYSRSTPIPYAALGAQAIVQDDLLMIFGGEDRPRSRSDRLYLGKIRLVPATPPGK
jgi:N-acetylneuraminic acid mutarotase